MTLINRNAHEIHYFACTLRFLPTVYVSCLACAVIDMTYMNSICVCSTIVHVFPHVLSAIAECIVEYVLNITYCIVLYIPLKGTLKPQSSRPLYSNTGDWYTGR